MNGVFLVLRGDSVHLTADKGKLNDIGRDFEWKINDANNMGNNNLQSDSSITVSFDEAKDYNISLTQDGTSYIETKKFKVFDSKKKYDEYVNFVNSKRGQVLGNSRQNPRKFRYNAPKDGYIYGYNKFSKR